jgi:hypothetical protein
MCVENCIGWRMSVSDPKNVRIAFCELTFAAPKLEALVNRTKTRMVLADRQVF